MRLSLTPLTRGVRRIALPPLPTPVPRPPSPADAAPYRSTQVEC